MLHLVQKLASTVRAAGAQECVSLDGTEALENLFTVKSCRLWNKLPSKYLCTYRAGY